VNLHVIERSDALTHIALEGDLDIAGVNAVQDPVYFNLTSRKKPAIVDMSAVKFIGSLGIGMLVRVAQSLRRQGFPMVLVNPCGMVDQALRLTNIHLVIPIATSREEALAKLG
jgi:anti-anti-sigma factor